MIEAETDVPKEVRFSLRDNLVNYPAAFYGVLPISAFEPMVKRAILGTYRMLHELGEGNLADNMIMFDRRIREQK